MSGHRDTIRAVRKRTGMKIMLYAPESVAGLDRLAQLAHCDGTLVGDGELLRGAVGEIMNSATAMVA